MDTLAQHCLIGLTTGSLIALVALGYTMVYGIIELVNFAHGDLVMLGSFLALTLLSAVVLAFGASILGNPLVVGLVILTLIAACALFCAILNVSVDFIVYRPLRNAPKLAPLVSAI